MAKIIKKPNDLKKNYRKTLLKSFLFYFLTVFNIAVMAMFFDILLDIGKVAVGVYAVAVVALFVVARYFWRNSAIIKAGLDGESDASKVLAELPDDFVIFQNLKISFKGKVSETDLVVCGPSGVFVVETKNLSGNITGDYTSKNWVQKKPNGKIKKFYSPVKQVGTHVFRLANFLRENNISARVEAAVYFAKTETHVNIFGEGESIPVFSAMKNGEEELRRYIKKGSHKLSKNELSKLVSFLEHYKI